MSWRTVTIAALAILLVGCTVIPKALNTQEASWDGNQQNSGELGWFTNSAGVVQQVVSPHWRERYNGLIAEFGDRFSPRTSADAGLTAFTNGTWLVDDEHLGKFTRMNVWRLQRPP